MAEMAVHVPRGHAAYWAIIREFDAQGPWCVSDVDGQSNAGRREVSAYVSRLVRAGLAHVVEHRRKGPTPVPYYRLLDRRTEAPRLRRDGSECQPTANEQMWRAMRSLATFDAKEIAFAASTDVVTVNEVAAKDYIKRLAGAGYLVVVQEAKAGRKGRPAIWRLKPAMNTGPLPPLIMRTKFVWDANRQVVMGPAATAEEVV
ncbi:hypothetical protein KHC23_00115 [Ancylobacter dichloromethanicus]|nr:hypothetical protein [Ancylobacter dichloromethanicus]MBS7552063.1 hypothetical protein [Ancylobacter dichloromethanicus]